MHYSPARQEREGATHPFPDRRCRRGGRGWREREMPPPSAARRRWNEVTDRRRRQCPRSSGESSSSRLPFSSRPSLDAEELCRFRVLLEEEEDEDPPRGEV